MNIKTDGQGLVEVPAALWAQFQPPEWFTYIGGRDRRYLAYRVGTEEPDGVSELPPPSVQSLRTIVMYARRDGYLCHLCGGSVSLRITDPLYPHHRASLDHVTPRAAGGSDYPSNLLTAHLSCNKSRGSRSVSDSRRMS